MTNQEQETEPEQDMTSETDVEEVELQPDAEEGSDAVSGEEAAMGKLQTDFEKFRDLALRSQADLDNYRKRAAREKTDAIKYANIGLLEDLLPIIDNFQLGLEAARSDEGQSAVLEGMGMVLRQMEDFLRDNHVTVIDASGLPFDPNQHEALAYVPSDEVEEGIVIDQVRKGYMLKDRLLRAAKVTVSKGPAAE